MDRARREQRWSPGRGRAMIMNTSIRPTRGSALGLLLSTISLTFGCVRFDPVGLPESLPAVDSLSATPVRSDAVLLRWRVPESWTPWLGLIDYEASYALSKAPSTEEWRELSIGFAPQRAGDSDSLLVEGLEPRIGCTFRVGARVVALGALWQQQAAAGSFGLQAGTATVTATPGAESSLRIVPGPLDGPIIKSLWIYDNVLTASGTDAIWRRIDDRCEPLATSGLTGDLIGREYRGELYVGARGGVWRFRDPGWERIGPPDSSMNTTCLEEYQGRLVFSGDGEGDRPIRVWSWDGQSVDTIGGAVAVRGRVLCLRVFQGMLVAGGGFGGSPSGGNLATWDGDMWQIAQASFEGGWSPAVVTASEWQGRLVVGASGEAYHRSLVAQGSYDPMNRRWSWEPMGAGLRTDASYGRISSFVSDGGLLYAGAQGGRSGSRSVGPIAVWDGTVWRSARDAVTGQPVPAGEVNALIAFKGRVYAASGQALLTWDEAAARAGSWGTKGSRRTP